MDDGFLLVDAVCKILAVNVLEIIHHEKVLCGIPLSDDGLSLRHDLLHDFPLRSALPFEAFQFLSDESDLFFVRETEHIIATVMERVAVIFLMAAPLRLDLAFERQREAGFLEFRGRFRAHVIEAVHQLGGKPARIRRVTLDMKLPRRRRFRQVCHRDGRRVFVDTVVHHAAAEKMFFHPVDDFAIETFRHEERYAEFPKKSLECPFPLLLLGLHFHDFPGKWHIFLRHLEVAAEVFADGNEGGRDITISLQKGLELCLVRRNLECDLLLLAVGLEFLRIQCVVLRLELAQQVFELFSPSQEILQHHRHRKPQHIRIVAVVLRLLHHLREIFLAILEFFFRIMQAVAAILPHFLLLGVDIFQGVGEFRLKGRAASTHFFLLPVALCKRFREELDFLPRQIRLHPLFHQGELALFEEAGIIGIRRLHDRAKKVHLLAVTHDGIMDALQVMETGEEALDILFHLRPVHITKHVLADEIGDPIHFLHGDGLLEKVERVITHNAEERLEFHRIRGVVIEYFHIE